ncbi:MAG: response regulator [Betaproteobacteria bacterium]|nr:response regulator [Betaproteobacteria bacterium]
MPEPGPAGPAAAAAADPAGPNGAPPPPAGSEPAAADAAREAAFARTERRLNMVAWLALVLPALAFAAVARWQYDETLDSARAQIAAAADVTKEHALKLFDTNEMLLQRMLDLAGDDSTEQLLARGVELHQRLALMTQSLPQVQALFINDAQGRAVANNLVYPPDRKIDYTDRSWYRWHSQPGRSPLFVSERLTSRATGEPFFDFSRRRIGTDGRYVGSVHVSIRPGYLIDFWADMAKSQPGLRLALLRTDGDFLARWPRVVPAALPADHEVLERLRRGAPGGTLEGPGHSDGVERLAAFRRLDGYPVFVYAGIDRATVLAGWQRRVGLLALFVFPTAFGFAASALLALKRTQDELAALRRADAEAERRRRAELALVHSQKLEAMGRLTGGVAHDFNNVLSIVATNAELLRRMQPALAESAPLARIGRAVDAGTKLTRQLLAFTRKQALVRERVALAERLPALLDLIRPLVGATVEVSHEVAPGTGAIEVDVAEFELALVNLAANATDAMQRRGRLKFTVRPAAAAEVHALTPSRRGEFVLLDVDDSGPGIPREAAEQVFEPFYTSKPPGSGTGLGLAQVRNLCRGAGGDAFVLKSPLGGARVRLLLAALPPATAISPASAAPRDPGSEARLTGRRVLLVEDNTEVAASTRALLEALGCRVQRVAGADEALLALENGAEAPDAVLSDVQMPGSIDGIEFADRLAARRGAPPVVLMTGYADRIEQARTRGHEVLPKPCSTPMLAEALARAFARGAAVADA